jgi:hypothetical protein
VYRNNDDYYKLPPIASARAAAATATATAALDDEKTIFVYRFKFYPHYITVVDVSLFTNFCNFTLFELFELLASPLRNK